MDGVIVLSKVPEEATKWRVYFLQCLHDGYWVDTRSEADRGRMLELRDEYQEAGIDARAVVATCRVLR